MAEQTVGAGYFAVLNEPILAGREFDERDKRVDAEAAIASGVRVPTLPLVLNEKAARALFGKDGRFNSAYFRRRTRGLPDNEN